MESIRASDYRLPWFRRLDVVLPLLVTLATGIATGFFLGRL